MKNKNKMIYATQAVGQYNLISFDEPQHIRDSIMKNWHVLCTRKRKFIKCFWISMMTNVVACDIVLIQNDLQPSNKSKWFET